MKKQKKGKKTNKGITLIALVVTIVILIILATIGINAVFGEHGIIATAQYAREEHRAGSVQDEVSQWKLEKITAKGLGEEVKLRAQLLDELVKEKLLTEEERKIVEEDNEVQIASQLIVIEPDEPESLNPNLEIAKEVTSTPTNGKRYAVGEEVQYKITVTNIGTKTVKNIKIEDTLKAKDIATKEEKERYVKIFEKLYDETGKEIGNSLNPGQIGYITYSYKVQEEDLGKELRNFATVKGKTYIPKGEKPVVTPTELPTDTIYVTKKVDIGKDEIFSDSITNSLWPVIVLFQNDAQIGTNNYIESPEIIGAQGIGYEAFLNGDSIEWSYDYSGDKDFIKVLKEEFPGQVIWIKGGGVVSIKIPQTATSVKIYEQTRYEYCFKDGGRSYKIEPIGVQEAIKDGISPFNEMATITNKISLSGGKEYNCIPFVNIQEEEEKEIVESILGDAINTDKYGWKVTNYNVKEEETGGWRLFYQDSRYTYIISDNCIGSYSPEDYAEKYESGADISDIGQKLNSKMSPLFYSNYDRPNILATAWLTDPSIWNEYANSDAKYAIGSPTAELFAASYNNRSNKSNIIELNLFDGRV